MSDSKRNSITSWRIESVLTVIMLGLVSFFAYWQVVDHFRLRREQKKVITFLNNDISTALAGILNSQPRFGPIVLKDSIAEKVNELINSGKGNPVKGVAFFNSQGKLLFSLKKPGTDKKWYKSNAIQPYIKISRKYEDIAAMSGLEGSHPIIGDRSTVIAMVNLISTSPDENLTEDLAPGGDQIGLKIKKIMSEEYFKEKTVNQVSFLLDVDFLYKTIAKDMVLRGASLLFCLIAFSFFTYSLFNLNHKVKLKVLLAQEQEATAHFRELHLLAAGLAHEIKNPLNVVRGTTQSIAELKDKPEEIKKKTAIVAEEVDRINSRINSFMAYSNLKPPKLKKLAYKNVIDEIISLLKVDSEEKQVKITSTVSDKMILADEETLRQVIFNLLHNAIKAVKNRGEIQIKSGEMAKHRIWLEISDNGPGIPENAVDDIFTPYFTLDSSGTGLGLAIVKQLVFNHGWKIKYTGKEGQGARFRIEGIKLA